MNNSSCSDCTFSSTGLVLYSAILAITISQNMTIEEMDLLSNLLQAVGQNLGIIAAVVNSCDSQSEAENTTNDNNKTRLV